MDKSKKLTVVYVEPEKPARVKEIGSTLKDLQAVVGGYIQAVYLFKENVCVVCNEEGKLNDMKPNRGIYRDDGKLIDVIVGPFFICAYRGEDFVSLDEEQQERYKKLYEKPERFFVKDGEIYSAYMNEEEV